MNFVSARKGRMIWKKRSVDSTKDYLRLRVSLLVELHRVVNCLPRVGKQRRNVHDVRLESYVFVTSHEPDGIPLALVKGRYLQETKRRVTGVIVRLNQEDALAKDLIPPTCLETGVFLGDLRTLSLLSVSTLRFLINLVLRRLSSRFHTSPLDQ